MVGSLHMKYSVIILLFVVCTLPFAVPIKVRIVTWNTGDNKNMKDGFTNEAIDKVLGLDLMIASSDMPSIYAIALQQECWMCNRRNLPTIGKRFLCRINKANITTKYRVIGVEGTRMGNLCEKGCTLGTHGSTVLVIIARQGVISSHIAFHQTNDCSNKMIPNPERGVAAIKTNLSCDKIVCFAAVHLEPKVSKYKRTCLAKFFETANEKSDWTASCDAQFLFGDFNTKTGDNTKGSMMGLHFSKATHFNSLKSHDELTGVLPYGTDSKWKHNLLTYINSIQGKHLQEGPLQFMPTYPLENSQKYCDNKFPCYSTNRPLSWPDRILYSNGKRVKYDAIYEDYASHFPVFAEYYLFAVRNR